MFYKADSGRQGRCALSQTAELNCSQGQRERLERGEREKAAREQRWVDC